MTDIVRIGDATLYHGDCLEILPTLGKFDAVITDPPYGIRYSSAQGGKWLDVGIVGDESTLLRDAALSKINQGAGIVFGSWKAAKPKGVKQVLIWDKGDHVGMGDLSLPWRPNTEEIYIIGNGFSGHRGSSVLRFNAPSPNFTPECLRFHPTEKPVALVVALLGKCKGKTVIDPFMGSGTTGVACAQLGRKFTGIEIERKYFDIACERIERAYAQGQLIPHEPAPKPEQEGLAL